MKKRDFLSLLDCSPEELGHLVARGREFKKNRDDRDYRQDTRIVPIDRLLFIRVAASRNAPQIICDEAILP